MFLVLTLVLGVFLSGAQATFNNGEDYQIVSFDDVKKGLDAKSITLLDVRTVDERKCPGRIPGSVNVPVESLPDAFEVDDEAFKNTWGFDKPVQPGTEVVVSCQSGGRARQAIDLLVPLGYTDLKLYAGSFQDWVDKGGDVISEC